MASRYFENAIRGYEQVGNNLYKYDGHYFRLFGFGITPNDCWLAGAQMRQLVDIDTATGNDVYSNWIQELELGTVRIYSEYIRLKKSEGHQGTLEVG
jgi:hypothetical protein